ncbi:MAG: lactate permease [Arcobacter sp.]|nr:MAG: lactate permease [Arcobacter sp.]
MENTSLARFNKRKKVKNLHTVYEKADEILVNEFLNSEVDEENVNNTFKATEEYYDVSVSKEEAEAFLIRFKKEFNDERFNQLVADCKKDVINSIVTPFGLGKIVAAYDKTGGNVDTIHNVREGVYATEKEKEAYENNESYYKTNKNEVTGKNTKTDPYHNDTRFKKKAKKTNEEKGERYDDLYQEQERFGAEVQLDHIISSSEIHNDAGRILSEQNGVDLSVKDSNLAWTNAYVNKRKSNIPMKEFVEEIPKIIEQKESSIQRNKEKLKNMPDDTPEQSHYKRKIEDAVNKEEKHIKELESCNIEAMLKADKKAREDYNKEINTYYKGKKFIKNTAITGVKEGAKMGIQQALGLVITEFFTAIFDEIMDIYKNGFYTEFDDSFFSVLKERIKRIGNRLKNSWKDVLIAFKDGAISGFISNLVTTVINTFVTTGKRVVRIIREGIFSLFRAVKILLFSPEGMSLEDRMHEVKKLIATGLIVSLGVIIEEYIDVLIKGTAFLEPFSDILTSIFVGAITGLSITMVVYYLDKKKNDKDAIDKLLSQSEQSYENIENMMNLSPAMNN